MKKDVKRPKSRCYIQTASGIFFDLLNPDPADVHLKDIADAGSKINRYTGHTVLPYSLNQHAVQVSRIAEDEGGSQVAATALFHDGEEPYTGDESTPLKRAKDTLGGAIAVAAAASRVVAYLRGAIRDGVPEADITAEVAALITPVSASAVRARIADGIREAVFRRFGLPWPVDPEVWKIVKFADAKALATEKRDLLADDLDWDYPMPPPRRHPISPWPWPKAADEFHARARELGIREVPQ